MEFNCYEDYINNKITRDYARKYFWDNKLSYDLITDETSLKLRKFINAEFKKYNKGKEHLYYIKCNEPSHYRFITATGGYFQDREVVSFNQERDSNTNNPHWIGFAGEADDKNVQPVLRGFINWCDWLLKQPETKEFLEKYNSKQLTSEDIIFLKKLREDLLLQEDSIEYNDGNAFPRFWGIMEDSYIYRSTCDFGGDEVFVSHNHCEEFEDIKEAKEFYEDAVDELEDEYYTKEYFKNNVIDFDDLKTFLNDTEIDDCCEILYKEKTEHLCQTTGAFLTKQDAKDYIQKYGYNHNNPRTYAMTGYRNFRLEKLLNIIKNTNWENLKNE